MSSTVISFIPVDHQWRVPDNAALSAERYLAEHYAGSTEIQINRSYTKPFFIDAGQNHEDVRCPECGGSISVATWQDAMEKCWRESDQGFDLSAATVQCCKREFAPNQLAYVPEQGFAMVSFEVTDPTRVDHSEVAAQLASMLKVPIRSIVARY